MNDSAQTTAPEARPASATATGDSPARRLGWVLAVCCAAQFMVILDLSIVNVALPHIQSALTFSNPELQWIVDAYAITFAGFLMFGGRAADHFGQRRVFILALVAFAVTSLFGGVADSREMLIGARGAQGLAGALMAACSLAIITSNFPAGPARNRAIGLWAAMNGAGGSAGVLFGGIITEALSWRWVLLINPPIGAAAAFLAYLVVREHRGARRGQGFDTAGALTLTAGQLVLVYGVVEAGLSGWSSAIALGPILGGIALLALFSLIERRFARNPLIPFAELTPQLRTANTIVLLFSASLFPMWFVSSLYLQQVLALSPLEAGLVFLPMTAMIAVSASRAGRLVNRYGAKPALLAGLSMLSTGMFLQARIGSSGSAVVFILLPGLLTCLGIGLSIVPSTIAATLGAKEGQAGLASGMVNTSRQVGGGLGLAVLVTLATQRSTHLIGSHHQIPDALTQGFRLAYLICGGLAAAALLYTALAMRAAKRSGAPPAWRLLAPIGALVVTFAGLDLAFANSRGAEIGSYVLKGSYSFYSEPRLHPPRLRTIGSVDRPALAGGYIVMANFYDLSEPPMVGQSGPLILESDLQPLWFQPVPESIVASNLSVQRYEGRPALAWWQGRVTPAGLTETGEDVVLDEHYRRIARLRATNGWVLTLHSIQISGHDIWVTANKNIPKDLSPYGGAYNGAMIDSAVQEYDLRDGRLLYSWDVLRHVAPSASYATLPTNGYPWDAYHINSVESLGGERFLVSMRNTWAAYLVDARSGAIEWTLGGKHSSFSFGRGAEFQWQHDVVMHPGDLISAFDDHCCQLTGGGSAVPATGPSRAIVLRLDMGDHRAQLMAQYHLRAEPHIETQYMGSAEPLSNGNLFVGWGSEPFLSEYSAEGRTLLDAELPRPDLSYRTLLQEWTGMPLSPPKGAVRRRGERAVVYASWNGASELRSWRLLAGASEAAMHVVASAAKSGFETAIPLSGAYASYELQALDAQGKLLATSRAFH